MKEEIYLIGQISVEDPITYQWRQDVRKFFKGSDCFEMIDPCDNEFNKEATNFDGSKGKDPKRLKIYKTKGVGLIVPKDYSYVMRSTGCLANLNHYDKRKPMIGTLFELAWYYQNQDKCVIGIFDGNPENDTHCNHPFVKAAVDIWCTDHLEAAQILRDYYRRNVT